MLSQCWGRLRLPVALPVNQNRTREPELTELKAGEALVAAHEDVRQRDHPAGLDEHLFIMQFLLDPEIVADLAFGKIHLIMCAIWTDCAHIVSKFREILRCACVTLRLLNG